MKKFLLVILTLACLLLVGCDKNPNDEIKEPVEDIKAIFELEETSATVKVGSTYTIEATLTGTDEYTVEVTPAGIVTYDGLTVTAIQKGTVTVKIGLKNNPELVKEFIITVVTDTDPIIEMEEGFDKDVQLETDDEFDCMAGVKATDAEDGDITSKITHSEFSSAKAGTVLILYEVTDNDGNKVQFFRSITIIQRDVTAPVISLKADAPEVLKIAYGEEYDASDIIATDDKDGDVTDSITIVTPVDSKRYNEQICVVEAIDAHGNKATFERKVQVEWDYQTMYIGHAGSYYGIQNTEEAFINAAKTLHYQAIECDLKQTSDGVFVMCHDDTFGGKTLASITWDNLKDVVATGSRTAGYPGASNYNTIPNGTGQYESKICTLARYLEICKEYGCLAIIELKSSNGITNSDQSRMSALMKEIEKAGMLHQVAFLGSQYNCLIWVKQHGYDYIPCQYLVNSLESDTVYNRCLEYDFEVSINVTGGYSNSDSWVQKYQHAGIKISTWTFTQYVDYAEVQSWIDKGVDYVTTDWQEIEKLQNYKKSEIIPKHEVKFLGLNDGLIETLYIKDGTNVTPSAAPNIAGYKFVRWDGNLENVTEDRVIKAVYELDSYTISYVANDKVVEVGAWATKEEFVSDFYNDLFNWLDSQVGKMNGLTKTGNTYKLVNNSSSNGTATWTDVTSLRSLDVYQFEAAISCHLYKQIEGTNSADYVPLADENYFLNCDLYRAKYQGMNAYLLNCMNTSYTSYSKVFKPASNDRVQIFFRFHQWCKGTNIPAFNNYPAKYTEKQYAGVTVTLPTDNVSYTIEEEITLSAPVTTGPIEFVGWYTNPAGTGEAVTKINKGQSGNIVLYAKWNYTGE